MNEFKKYELSYIKNETVLCMCVVSVKDIDKEINKQINELEKQGYTNIKYKEIK